jgi:2-polyprenyl-3-methyl-5-hydroxy-6-metoxy-1,4-benzoquinol methylase
LTLSDVDKTQARARLRQLASQSIESGDPTGWFEDLYRDAEGNAGAIPWAHLRANPLLTEWVASNQPNGEGKRTLVVGCGLGDDAEAMARFGFDVTAFDVSLEAIAWCRRRFPDSQVCYTVANALAMPVEWSGQFDLVVEIYTLQSLPNQALRGQVAAHLARCIAPNGSLLVICGGRDQNDEPGSMPWPLTRAELAAVERLGLRETSFEDLLGREEPFFRQFRVHYQR